MPERVLILGGGFAGVSVARELERLKPTLDVTLVDRENATLFTPLLPEIAAGDIELRHILRPLRASLRKTRVIAGEVVSLDIDERSAVIRHSIGEMEATLPYDQVVIALGAESSTFGLPGVPEHTIPMKTARDAVRLRNQVIRALEAADARTSAAERGRMLTFIVVGGGFTGVEITGELHKLLHTALVFYRGIAASEIRIVLVESASRLLADLPESFGSHAGALLNKCGIELCMNQRVARASSAGLELASGKSIPSAVIVWCAGSSVPPVVGMLPLRKSRRGSLIVRTDFLVEGHEDVWAVGDCAEIPGPGGLPYPSTAQHALREGRALARNLAAKIAGQPTRPFVYRSLGMMASLGCGRGIVQLGQRRMISGPLAWFIWRAYYLMQIPGWGRKIRVVADWLPHAFLPRDIVLLHFDDQVNAQRPQA